MNNNDLKNHWAKLDEQIRDWWDADLRQAQEAGIRDVALNAIWYSDDEHRALEQKNDPEYTLLFLPFPYVSGGGSEAAFPEMYCWDSFFVNLGLIAHERFDLVRQHILNHLFMVKNLQRFEHDYGLAQTAEAYPSPHPEFEWLQWNYPTGWPPMQLMVIEGLDRYGYAEAAARVVRKFLTMMIELHQSTGKLWEKYNVVEGNTNLPRERYVSQPLHGWSCAAVVLLGRRIYGLE